MFQVDIGQVKVHTLHQQVGGDEHFLVGIGKYGAVVAYTVLCTFVLDVYVFREAVNESELTQFCYFHPSVG